MKNLIRNTLVSVFFIAASMAFAATSVPTMSVTVSDSSGKATYKGATNGSGAFATTKLQPGKYVVQLNSTSAGVKGNYYAVVVGAGTKKVSANSVPGEKLAGGGVALKIDVASNVNITGQVAVEDKGAVNANGKKMVWIPKQLGSNIPGHWVEADSAEAKSAKTAGNISRDALQKRQDHGDVKN